MTDQPTDDQSRPNPDDFRDADGRTDWAAFRQALRDWEPDDEPPASEASGG